VGFFRFRSHEVEDIERCPLLRPAVNDALTSLREQVRASGPPAPEIDIAGSEEERAWSSVPTGSGVEVLPTRSGPGIASHPGLLRRRVGPFGYLVSPGVFFQANDFLVDELARAVEEFAGGRGDRSALDLYCGVGLFSLPLARRYQSVTAVESSPSAAALCRANADSAGLNNVRVVCAEVAGWMGAVGSVSAPGFELIVLDPPRTGAGTDVMNRIRDWAPETLIYVSCDPQTMCRDLTALPQRDYRIDEVLGIDLFPQTYHFETVLRVVRR
jgi:23S rRNA (uracil1939-C5)-methyltransferase